jgi:hypothetical protein
MQNPEERQTNPEMMPSKKIYFNTHVIQLVILTLLQFEHLMEK